MVAWLQKLKIKTILLVVGVLVVAAGAGVAVRVLTTQQTQESHKKAPALPEVISKVQDLEFAGKQDEANKKIDEALADPNTSNDIKYQLYLKKGASESQAGDYQAALDAYNSALAIREDYNSVLAVASAAQQAGDKQKAITYYKKAITLMPNSPTRDDELSLLQQQIKTLEDSL